MKKRDQEHETSELRPCIDSGCEPQQNPEERHKMIAEEDSYNDQHGPTIHPDAEMPPLMNAQELKRFTQDIRGDGLREPLILDEKDRVIDGRNRVTTLTLL